MLGLVYRVLTAPTPKWKDPEPPSLDNLRVVLPEPPPVTGEDILARLEMWRQGSAVTTSRPLGAPVERGDLVQVNLVVFSGGKLVPFSAQEDLRLILDGPGLQRPALAALVGAPVGAMLKVEDLLPADHSAVAFRNQPAIHVYAVRAAWSRTLVPVDDPELFPKLGLGQDAQHAAMALQADLDDQRRRMLEGQITRSALDELVRRTQVEVPKMLVQKLMLQRWSSKEGKFLQSNGVDSTDCDAAFEAWLRDPEMADGVRSSIARSLVLRAVARKLGMKFDALKLRHDGAMLAPMMGMGSARAMEDQASASEVGSQLMISDMSYLEVIAEVRRRVTVELTPSR